MLITMCFIVFGSWNIKLNFYMNIKIIIFSNYSWFYHSISFHAFLPYEMGKSLQPEFYSVIYDIIVLLNECYYEVLFVINY